MAKKEQTSVQLQRLKEALASVGVGQGNRDKTVAEATGYAPGSVRSILTGHAVLTDRFVTAVCAKFGVRLEWVTAGEGPMVCHPGNEQAGFSCVDEQPLSIRAEAIAAPLSSEAEYIALLRDIGSMIRLYFSSIDQSGVLGWAAHMAFLNFSLLPPHEMIDLVYQFRKILDGDSDQLATAAADAKLRNSGIVPKTRLRLERIPVTEIPGNQS